jgi:hypothetical protein
MITKRRRSKRSAKNPPIGVRKILGIIAAKVTQPTITDEESDKSKASHPLPTIIVQIAIPANVLPVHKLR